MQLLSLETDNIFFTLVLILVNLTKSDRVSYQIFVIADTMRKFMLQLRQETGIRVCDKVFDPNTDKPSKVGCMFVCVAILSEPRVSML